MKMFIPVGTNPPDPRPLTPDPDPTRSGLMAGVLRLDAAVVRTFLQEGRRSRFPSTITVGKTGRNGR